MYIRIRIYVAVWNEFEVFEYLVFSFVSFHFVSYHTEDATEKIYVLLHEHSASSC